MAGTRSRVASPALTHLRARRSHGRADPVSPRMQCLLGMAASFAGPALLLFALTGCATNPATGRSDFVTMSEQQEIATGEQVNREVLQQYAVYQDAALQTYVNGVGQRVATHGHRPGLSYRFTVLDSPETNAFALPGGYIYITRGMLAYLNSEAELAAVLGHEVGHVTARHSVRQQSTAQVTSLGAGLLSIFVPQLGQVGRQAVSLLGTALVRGYGREHELEADRLGAEYLARSGYDPNAVIDVLRTLKAQEALDQQLAQLEGRQPRAYHGLFSTHPDSDTRLREAIDHARTVLGSAPATPQVGRDRFLDEIEGLVIGNNPAEGVVRGHSFMHPELDFVLAFPDGWSIENQPNRLVATEPAGRAQMQVSLVGATQDETPEAVLQRLGVREFVQGKRLTIAGHPAVSGFTRVTVQGVARVARISVIRRGPQQAFILTGLTAREQDLPSLDPVFVEVARSFRALTDKERSGIRPRRLRVADLEGPVTWASLAKASGLKRLPEAQLKVLNAAAPTDAAPVHKRIKLIE